MAMELSQYIVPACLPTEPVEDAKAVVTGWGPIHYNTKVSDILQKGDSGGPLQIKSDKINCMYIVVGVTSHGRKVCSTPDSAGVYTKVDSYVPWIENIVWSN
ncbi:unnamed protein product [Spodoptera littoralis]|uniref:Peptidase S1 domain-containing protein n=1 Tax=Spodoptera littoralis TaxID=7109 RepID=A0A9P0N7D5_SPOLI|nr:unnamed protein product [Spodoptera littoralis]CAH1642515.1 unnamed protein product [Spodoptera littoralis]